VRRRDTASVRRDVDFVCSSLNSDQGNIGKMWTRLNIFCKMRSKIIRTIFSEKCEWSSIKPKICQHIPILANSPLIIIRKKINIIMQHLFFLNEGITLKILNTFGRLQHTYQSWLSAKTVEIHCCYLECECFKRRSQNIRFFKSGYMLIASQVS